MLDALEIDVQAFFNTVAEILGPPLNLFYRKDRYYERSGLLYQETRENLDTLDCISDLIVTPPLFTKLWVYGATGQDGRLIANVDPQINDMRCFMVLSCRNPNDDSQIIPIRAIRAGWLTGIAYE